MAFGSYLSLYQWTLALPAEHWIWSWHCLQVGGLQFLFSWKRLLAYRRFGMAARMVRLSCLAGCRCYLAGCRCSLAWCCCWHVRQSHCRSWKWWTSPLELLSKFRWLLCSLAYSYLCLSLCPCSSCTLYIHHYTLCSIEWQKQGKQWEWCPRLSQWWLQWPPGTNRFQSLLERSFDQDFWFKSYLDRYGVQRSLPQLPSDFQALTSLCSPLLGNWRTHSFQWLDTRVCSLPCSKVVNSVWGSV